jgi:hypothetical protein
LVFHEFCECLVRVAVELREIDGVPLRAWVSEILKDGEAHQNEKDTLAEEVNNFILQALEPLADRCGTRPFCTTNKGSFCQDRLSTNID